MNALLETRTSCLVPSLLDRIISSRALRGGNMKAVIEVADRDEKTLRSLAEYISQGGDAFIAEVFGDGILVLTMEVVS